MMKVTINKHNRDQMIANIDKCLAESNDSKTHATWDCHGCEKRQQVIDKLLAALGEIAKVEGAHFKEGVEYTNRNPHLLGSESVNNRRFLDSATRALDSTNRLAKAVIAEVTGEKAR